MLEQIKYDIDKKECPIIHRSTPFVDSIRLLPKPLWNGKTAYKMMANPAEKLTIKRPMPYV